MDKGAIGFPENDENPKSANKQNRVPVFLPAKCPENELYYPGDQDSDWICDCRPGYLYHPGTDACWLAYKRGPCPAGQYLVLPKTSVIPICDNNPCIADNLVMWQGKCEVLGVIAPCGNKYPPKALWGGVPRLRQYFNRRDAITRTVALARYFARLITLIVKPNFHSNLSP
ncbi:unnamed protein product, partial [Iphiclides podalirius]